MDRSIQLTGFILGAAMALLLLAGVLLWRQPPPGTGSASDSRRAPVPPAPAQNEEKPELPPDLGFMARVPEGWFVMGSDTGKPFEKPRHRVYLDEYYIDLYEVTNHQYREYVRASGAAPPPHWKDGTYAEGRFLHPVVNVTWEDARAYASWAGKRLPTEAEWEKACRGPEGTKYAYGDEFDASCTNSCDSGICDMVPVDHFQAGLSFYGCYNMTGNVWEWVSDWFSATYYKDGQRNPKGPPAGSMRVGKGGSWTTDADSCRGSFRCRSLPGSRWGYAGFRCARSAREKVDIAPPGEENMILVPAGEFLMGSDENYFESPQRKIDLDAFLIDRMPVTNREFLDFCEATGHRAPPHWHAGYYADGTGSHPVNNVTLDEARAFAGWAGKRLPTEAQWEKAARGADGREYPWGNDFDQKKCNTDGARVGRTVPVGSYPNGASPYGVLGMCGNVWEWVEGVWDPSFFKNMPDRNPVPAAERDADVLRGGTWSTLPMNCRTHSRCPGLPGCRWGYTGFRCVKDAPAKGK